MSRLRFTRPWKFGGGKTKLPMIQLTGNPLAHNGRTRTQPRIVRRINSRSAILPSLGTLVERVKSPRVGGERSKEESDRTSLSLSLSPRLFINALIRGELLERWYISETRGGGEIHIPESRCVPLISPVVLTDATRFYNLSRPRRSPHPRPLSN